MPKEDLIVIGAGGHGKVVADAALAAGFHVLGFIDDVTGDVPIPGTRILGAFPDLSSLLSRFPEAKVVVTVGDNAARQRIVQAILGENVGAGDGSVEPGAGSVGAGARPPRPDGRPAVPSGLHPREPSDPRLHVLPSMRFAAVIHPAAVVSPYARIQEGTVVVAGAVVNPGAYVGAHAILNTACSVDHDCQIGAFAHLSPGVHLAGSVVVGEGAHLGVGVSVIPRCHVGAWSVVGAGAVVVRDIPPGVVAYGVPARMVRRIRGEQ